MSEVSKNTMCGNAIAVSAEQTADMRQARWIGGAGNTFLRKKFKLSELPCRAMMHIIADAHSYSMEYWMKEADSGNEEIWLLGGSFIKYRLFINGRQIGAGPFRSVKKGISVLHAFDITPELREGDNVVGIISRGEGKGCAVLLELKFADGKTRRIASGGDWKMLDANCIYRPVCWESPHIDQYFKGHAGPGEYYEHIDGNKFPFGWDNPEFDDTNWQPSNTFGQADAEYEATGMDNYLLAPVLPTLIKRLGEDHYFIDFGREVVAGIELDAPESGSTVELRLGEELLAPYRVRFQMRTLNCYQELWTFPQSGSGTLAHFGLRAFRYAEVLNWRGDFTPASIRAVTVNAPFNDVDSQFECSDSRLVKVWEFCKNSIAWTSLDVYTDCPSRERIAYEADSYIAMLTHFAVEGNTSLARRTLEYQLLHPTWPCEWRQLMIPMFYEYLMHTGDYDLIRQYYETLKNDFSFHHLLEHGLVKEFPQRIIIDWPVFSRDNYEFGPHCTVPNAFAYYDFILLARLADYLERRTDAEKFQNMAQKLKDSFNVALFDQEQGLYRDNSNSAHCSFHANMFALCFGLVPEERMENCLNFLMERGMVCSVYAAQFFLMTLFKFHRAEYALKLMTAENDTSWLGMIKMGATVCCEAWSPLHKHNMSWAHPWSSSPGNMIVRGVFGLRPLSPGWKDYAFDPQPGGIESGKITIPTPCGKLFATFSHNRGRNPGKCVFTHASKFLLDK